MTCRYETSQACKELLGSSVAVFYFVSLFSLLSAIPFLFVESPTKPATPASKAAAAAAEAGCAAGDVEDAAAKAPACR